MTLEKADLISAAAMMIALTCGLWKFLGIASFTIGVAYLALYLMLARIAHRR